MHSFQAAKHPLIRLNAFMPCRLGPFVTTLLGVLLHIGGYLAIWFTATHDVMTPPYWMLLLFAAVACNGQTWFETAALVTCVKNFETER